MNNNMILLKTLLLSTSGINKLRHCKDKKVKTKIVWGYIGMVFLYLMLAGYAFATVYGYGMIGVIDSAPGLCVLTLSLIAFLFTFFKTNGYLFAFKEYDMLMALPFEPKAVVGCKFLYMYLKNLPLYATVSVAVMIGYGMFEHPGVVTYVMWIILTAFIPLIPMVLASFVGFLIARLSSGFKHKTLVQTVITFIFALFCFSLRFIIEGIFRNDEVDNVLGSIADVTDRACEIYLPAGWFASAVNDLNISSALLLAGVSILIFEVVFILVGRSYRQINSRLKSHSAAKNFHMTKTKKRSVRSAVAYKEYRRLVGSTTYMVNGAMGEILAVILGILVLVIGFDKLIGVITNGAPIEPEMIFPAIPFVAYFLIGMVATTACSPSLEGKNYWIVQSLPIEKKVLYQGKMLFNMYLSVPFMEFAILCLCIAARVPLLTSLLYMITGFVLCAFSSAWGCVCGIKHMKLDWENEIEVIKQGTAVALYLFPNMIIDMALVVLVIFLGTKIDHNLLAAVLILIVAMLAMLSYRKVMRLAAVK